MSEHVDVLIIGAGLSGIGAACRLRTEHPGRSVAVLEARDALGGTWDLFRYPGVRSDSDMFTFGFKWRHWEGDVALTTRWWKRMWRSMSPSRAVSRTYSRIDGPSAIDLAAVHGRKR